MAFDIHQLDGIDRDAYDEAAEDALEKYQDALIEQFVQSPEGRARLQADPEMGFWAAQLIYYGYQYIGVSVPEMTADDVDEVVTDLFPRKVSTLSPDDADDVIPELLAFWQFLKRQYRLANADAILGYLRGIAPQFKGIMNDPSRFGMAKSFFMMGQAAGFDMTNEADATRFIVAYNAGVLSRPPELPASTRRTDLKKKKLRKMAEASRRRARRKRK